MAGSRWMLPRVLESVKARSAETVLGSLATGGCARLVPDSLSMRG